MDVSGDDEGVEDESLEMVGGLLRELMIILLPRVRRICFIYYSEFLLFLIPLLLFHRPYHVLLSKPSQRRACLYEDRLLASG